MSASELPRYSQVVICGGGIAGASVAYHLAKLGVTDVTLVERHQLTSGTTWHAAGLIMQLRATHALTELAKYNVDLYASLEGETGVSTGFRQTGTLGVCRNSARLHETCRVASIARSFDIEAQIITASEALAIYPAIDARQIEGAIFIPQDGQTNPVDTTQSLIAGARQRGVKIVENCEVVQLWQTSTQDYEVQTTLGEITAEVVVLACGLWTRALAAQLGVHVPLYPCEHYYVMTEPVAAATPGLPVLRDTDGHCYVKEDAGKWLVGAFEPTGKPLDFSAIPANVPFLELPEDWDQFELPFTRAAEILPELQNIGITKFLAGPESFTPDLLFLLGEVSERRNLFVSAGYNSEGIELNPGAGRALAEWIVAGKPTVDLGFVNVNRFHSSQNNPRYLETRSREVLGLHYKMNWPHRQKESARGVRQSVLHDRWVERNASFGEAAMWERPMWFARPDGCTGNVYSHQRPNWFAQTAEECHAAREKAIILDQSSFGKFLVQGRQALEFLQWACAKNVDVPNGKIVYTMMLNDRGGIEVDLTVNRLREDCFLLITSATSASRDLAWMQQQIVRFDDAVLTDVTHCYTVLSIQGPTSREMLSMISNADFGCEAFPFATSKTIEIGLGEALANRLTFIGELGFELLIATEFAQDICDRIMDAGTQLGLKPAGYHALEHLRVEAGYREFDLDLTPEDTPLEAGLPHAITLDKRVDFGGHFALLKQSRREHLNKRLVQFKLQDPEPVVWGEEVIYRDDNAVGYLSSGAFSFTLGCSVGMGYVYQSSGVTEDYIGSGRWAVEIAGERYPVTASLQAFVDPNRKAIDQ